MRCVANGVLAHSSNPAAKQSASPVEHVTLMRGRSVLTQTALSVCPYNTMHTTPITKYDTHNLTIQLDAAAGWNATAHMPCSVSK